MNLWHRSLGCVVVILHASGCIRLTWMVGGRLVESMPGDFVVENARLRREVSGGCVMLMRC